MRKLLYLLAGLVLPALELFSQSPHILSGRVTDAANMSGLPGISVTAKKSKTITTTDREGKFSIGILAFPDSLEISHVGYFTEKIVVVSPGQALNIILKASANQLEEVVFSSGYERIRKERIVGAVSQLDSAAYARRAGMNILDRLDGTVPGMVFNRKVEALMQIRGISTLGGVGGISFDPLIIVDNFPYEQDISTLNPNDVEDITILKDAASASIWGTRAGNGVIVITTKRGRFNQPVQLSISSNISVGTRPDLGYFPKLDNPEVIEIEKFLFDKGFYNSALSNTRARPLITPAVEIFNQLKNGSITEEEAGEVIGELEKQSVRKQLEDWVYRHPLRQQHHLRLSGGNNTFRHSISGGFNYAATNIRGTRPDLQYTMQSNHSYRPLKGLEIDLGLQLNKEIVQSTSSNFVGDIFPYAQLADEEGNALAVPWKVRKTYIDTAGGGKLLDWQYRPLDEIRMYNHKVDRMFARVNLGLSWKISSWLQAQLHYQYSQENMEDQQVYSEDNFFTRDLINRYSQIVDGEVKRIIPAGAIIDKEYGSGKSSQGRIQFNLHKRWQKHDVTALLASDISETYSGNRTLTRRYGFDTGNSTSASGLDYSTQYPIYGQLSGSLRIPEGNELIEGQVNRRVSLLGNISYSYAGKYTFYGSARKDGSNVFGVATNNRWKPLWSAGANWNISEEAFYRSKLLSHLKFRVSIGYMGNVNNSLSGLPTLAVQTSYSSLTNLPMAQPGMAPNPSLRWEEVQTLNSGLDFTLGKGRVSGSVDVFRKNVKDLIEQIPIDRTTGVEFFTVNSGSLRGQGMELQVRTQNLVRQLKWETGFALSYAKMVVSKLGPRNFAAKDFVFNRVNPSEGKVVFGLSSYRWGGLDPVNGDPLGFLKGELSKNYISIFNDSVDNQIFHGSSTPLWTGFVRNTFLWKQFSLSANITYRLCYFYRKPALSYQDLFKFVDLNTDYRKRWQEPGDELHTSVPSLAYPANDSRDAFYKNAEINVLRADNIRLQDLRLQYDIKGNKRPISHVQIFIYANNLNLIIWRADGDKSKLDPDYGSYSVLSAPVPKTFTAGFSMSF